MMRFAHNFLMASMEEMSLIASSSAGWLNAGWPELPV
jgi:hypothetical protein